MIPVGSGYLTLDPKGPRYNTHSYEDIHTRPMHQDNASLDQFCDPANATHVAVKSGSWFSTTTWDTGTVPGDDAQVWIPYAFDVTYGSTSTDDIYWIRVDGGLEFAHDANTSMLVDTIYVTKSYGKGHGRLHIGHVGMPVDASVRCDITISSSRGDIDVSKDPFLMSRGIIVHGHPMMHGAAKTPWVRVAQGSDPVATDTTITLDSAPSGWQVGDVCVLSGTSYTGWVQGATDPDVHFTAPEDELFRVKAISGTTLTLGTMADETVAYALVNDHRSAGFGTAYADTSLRAFVQNMSRNIRIQSQDWADTYETTEYQSEASTFTANPLHRRGHFMLMHGGGDIRFVEMLEMGRTNKTTPLMPVFDIESFENPGTILSAAITTGQENVRARYPFHAHVAGTTDPADPAVFIGNSMWGTPGWGYVHHGSNAVFNYNVGYNAFGAGYVAEIGNENGSWIGNAFIFCKGQTHVGIKGNTVVTEDQVTRLFDTGTLGDGFNFRGRMVHAEGNICASTDHGFVYNHRFRQELAPATDQDPPGIICPDARTTSNEVEVKDVVAYTELVGLNQYPIRHFRDNEAFACWESFFIGKNQANQWHDMETFLPDLRGWNCKYGFNVDYSQHYIVPNLKLIGTNVADSTGIKMGSATLHFIFQDTYVRGFEKGAFLAHNMPSEEATFDNWEFTFIDHDIVGSVSNITGGANQVTGVGDWTEATGGWSEIVTADLENNPFSVSITGTEPFAYDNSPPTDYGGDSVNGFQFFGTKTDTIDTCNIPHGDDNYGVELNARGGVGGIVQLLTAEGYYTNGANEEIFIPKYFTERVTGDIYKARYRCLLGFNPTAYTSNGAINLSATAPTVSAGSASTSSVGLSDDISAGDVTINLGALISGGTLDNALPPNHGKVFDNGDGTVTYRPNTLFTGSDEIVFFGVNQFQVSRGVVTVTVS